MTTAEAIALPLNLDLITGRVSLTGYDLGLDVLHPNLETLLAAESTQFALIALSKGDRRPVDLTFTVEGEAVAVDLLSVKMAIKEFETSRRYDLHEGDGTSFQAVMRNGRPCYRFMISLSATQMRRILQAYADPAGTFADVIVELQAEFRYNPADSSTALSELRDVTASTDSVYLDIPLVQSASSKDYRLFVSIVPQPPAAQSGWGSPALSILNANNNEITITKTGGAFVAQDLSVSPALLTPPESWMKYFRPFVTSSLLPHSIAPTSGGGGVTLRVDLITALMEDATFGEMPETVWIAQGLQLYHGFSSGGYRRFGGSTPVDQIRLLASTAPLAAIEGTYTFPSSTTAATPLPIEGITDDGTMYVFMDAGGNGTKATIVFKEAPSAQYASTAHVWGGGNTVPIVATPIPSGPRIQFAASLVSQGDEAADEVTRVTSQSMVARLRRDLIPETAPPTS